MSQCVELMSRRMHVLFACVVCRLVTMSFERLFKTIASCFVQSNDIISVSTESNHADCSF